MLLEDRVTDLPLLSARQCAAIVDGVLALRAHWVQRHPRAPFYTLGASNYFDIASNSERPYERMAHELNPVLRECFGPLYRLVARCLAERLMMMVGYADDLALPGVHIFQSDPLLADVRGLTHAQWFEHRYDPDIVSSPIHCDTPHFVVEWGAALPRVEMTRPISFTLLVSMPAAGAGMIQWDLRFADGKDLDDAALHEALGRSRRILHRYRLGHLAVHDGMNYHQVAPMPNWQPGENRISLQGHGVPVDGVMRLFW
jgi:hypothetical protein